MKDLAYCSIKELRTLLDAKKISAQELFDFYKGRVKQFNSELQALLEDFEYESFGFDHKNMLSGIPGVLKDNICIQGKIASCGSNILKNYKAPYDATVTKRLKKAGVTFVGRANMDEFAMGSSTETSAFAKTKNPWDVSRVPGGSSGGSAVAVAAGYTPFALGTETGGSVRQPAGFCNIVGYKPTYGLISRYGLVAYGSSLDQAGIFARSAEDVAVVLSVLAGVDEHDSSSLQVQPKDYAQNIDSCEVAGLKIGIVENTLQAEGMDPEIAAAVENAAKFYESKGAVIKRIKLSTLDYGAATYFIISRAEAASNLARFDGVRYGHRAKDTHGIANMYQKTRYEGFGAEVRKRIMVGNYVLSAGHAGQFYENARRVVRLMRHEVKQAFANEVDMVIMPTSSVPAFKFGAFEMNKLQMDLQDYFTCPANLLGIPAVSLPCGFTKSGLPIGFQLLASHLDDERMLQVAHYYQKHTDWHSKRPSLV
ncbi:Asp-tRNA(Asn)/Glu-tRNA(Gln) amidotransferase subunit GatA [bacterium]|nr:MAG: Asp-tRNA(Asn)/Glu-tRNA(Gln) amidotransferase subunit GatA [bacterium]QQR61590.1 MAG: Asp-tRNA(Asn)/Glu-tRNA(Gln) amidotransferase subunit GatA [bacterium]